MPCGRLDHPLLPLKMEEGPPAKDCGHPMAAGQGKEAECPLEPPERNVALQAPLF